MADQEKEKSQELGLIDITEILSDYLRIFRKFVRYMRTMFALSGFVCLIFPRHISFADSCIHPVDYPVFPQMVFLDLCQDVLFQINALDSRHAHQIDPHIRHFLARAGQMLFRCIP